MINKLDQQMTKLDADREIEGGTHVIIGDNTGKSPVLVASTGADRVLNTNLQFGLAIGVNEEPNLEEMQMKGGAIPNITVSRKGDSVVDVLSGNLFSHVNASSAINVGNIGKVTASESVTKDLGKFGSLQINAAVVAKPSAESTTTILNGNSLLNIKGTGCVAGALAGGSAIALGGSATSQVTGQSQIIVNNSGVNDGTSINSMSIGLVGGGLAASAFGGKSTSDVGNTLIDVQKGVVIGAVGGGLALAGDIGEISKKVSIVEIETTNSQSGTSVVNSGNIQINLGKEAATAGVIGGGVTIADAYGQQSKNHGSSTSNVTSVQLNIDG